MSADMHTLRTRVLGSSATHEQIARAVDRHDRATDPARLREHEERARAWSGDHHARLAHVANLRTLREHGYSTHPDVVAALVEMGRQQAAQAAQDAIWRRSAAFALAQSRLAQIEAISQNTGWWRGLGKWYGLGSWYGVGTVCSNSPFGISPAVHS